MRRSCESSLWDQSPKILTALNVHEKAFIQQYNSAASAFEAVNVKVMNVKRVEKGLRSKPSNSVLIVLGTQKKKRHNLFRVDENSLEQCCAAHIVQCCQQYCSALLSPELSRNQV